MGINLFSGNSAEVKDAATRSAEAQEDQADSVAASGSAVETSPQLNFTYAHPQADAKNKFDQYLKRESILKFIPKERFVIYNDLIEQYDSLIEDCEYFGYPELAYVFHHSLTILEGNLRSVDGFERRMQTTSTINLSKTKTEGKARPESLLGDR